MVKNVIRELCNYCPLPTKIPVLFLVICVVYTNLAFGRFINKVRKDNQNIRISHSQTSCHDWSICWKLLSTTNLMAFTISCSGFHCGSSVEAFFTIALYEI